MSDETPETLYRYESRRYSVCIDAYAELYGTSDAELKLESYKVVAETPKGYWISFWGNTKDKWVSKTSRKRFAHPTEQEALDAYERRKRAFVSHAKARLNQALEDLALVDNPLNLLKIKLK